MEKPNILYNQSHGEYLNYPGVTQSNLKLIKKCPYLYQYQILEGNRKESTEVMKFGTKLHSLLLKRTEFKETTFVVPKILRRGKAWEAIQAKANGKEIIFKNAYKELIAMRDSILANEIAAKLLEKANPEVSIFWEMEDLPCKGCIDAVCEMGGGTALVDIKTTRDASKDEFHKNIFSLGYHIQAAFYLDGYKIATGKTPRFFILIAVEKEAPYLCSVHLLGNNTDIIKAGRTEYQYLLKVFKECNEADKWPAFEQPFSVYVPNWYKNLVNDKFS